MPGGVDLAESGLGSNQEGLTMQPTYTEGVCLIRIADKVVATNSGRVLVAMDSYG